MYMNLKPNKHNRIPFNTTTMASLGFIAPLKFSSPPNLIFYCYHVLDLKKSLGSALLPLKLFKEGLGRIK